VSARALGQYEKRRMSILGDVWSFSWPVLLGIAVVMFVVISIVSFSLAFIYQASQPAVFERPPSFALAAIDRIILGLELLAGNTACAISCFRHFVHLLFRNKERAAPGSPYSPEQSLRSALRLCAWSKQRWVGRCLGADRIDRALHLLQKAALMDPSAREARLAKSIDKITSLFASVSSTRSHL
jgi:hypothetical protein